MWKCLDLHFDSRVILEIRMESIPKLILAAKNGNLKEVDRLLTVEGVDINARAPVPLKSFLEENEEVIELPNLIIVGDTALLVAVRFKQYNIIKRLIELGADVNISNIDHDTALSVAISDRHNYGSTDLDSVNILVKVPGINMNGYLGNEILRHLIFIDYPKESVMFKLTMKIIETLVDAGADVNELYDDDFGLRETPLDLVLRNIRNALTRDKSVKLKELALYLLRHGARTSPGNEHSMLLLGSMPETIKNVMHKATWNRRRHAVMGWKTANPPNDDAAPAKEPAMGGAGGPSSSAANNNQGGGARRRSMKKRKASTTRRRRRM